MTQLSAAAIAGYASQAGFRGDALVKAVAIAIAESGGRTDAAGDIALQDGTWGPSMGLWQVRSIKAQYGTGGTRDASRLTDPAFNAAAAFSISGQGSSFTAWSTYTNGAYLANMGTARAAVNAPASSSSMGDAIKAGINAGPWNPISGLVNLAPSNAVGATGQAVANAGGGLLTGVDAIGGFFATLGQHGTWVRVLQVVGGGALLVGGVAIIGHGVVGSVATSLVPAGPVVKAAAGAVTK